MSTGVLEEIVAGHLRGIPRMNVEQFERYMESQFAGENVDCELLDGYPVIKDSAATGENPMIMGARHALVVNALNGRLVVLVAGSPWSVNCQTPIVLNELNVLEPDLTIFRGRNSDFLPSYPGPAAIVQVIEVADSSVEADRITKLEKYARESIPIYWIVNLREQQIEVYEAPDREQEDYLKCQIYRGDETVELSIPGLPVQVFPVQDILDGTI